jgi:hypothetical protein
MGAAEFLMLGQLSLGCLKVLAGIPFGTLN